MSRLPARFRQWVRLWPPSSTRAAASRIRFPRTFRSIWKRIRWARFSTGFLPPRFSVFDLNAQQALSGMSLDQKAMELIEERWRVLQSLRESRGKMNSYGRDVEAFEDFSGTAKRLLTDPRWPVAFQVSDDDRKRYGNTPQALPVHWPATFWPRTRGHATSTSVSTDGTITETSGIGRLKTITTNLSVISIPPLPVSSRISRPHRRRQRRERVCWMRRWWY